MTMNVHLVTHVVFCVKNLGPLWTQSMYSFESNNATFSRYVKGCKDVLVELSAKYMVHKSISREKHSISPTSIELRNKKKINLTASEANALIAANVKSLIKNNLFEIHCVCVKEKERFTSVNYSSAQKTNDYVVQLKNMAIGKVKFYFEDEGVLFLLLENYEYVDTIIHIHEIESRKTESVYDVQEIEKKFIHVNFSQKQYITDRPNQFESD